jgi:ATPase subunit of ABC transporter with duplicated ATPase domains
MKTAVEWLIEQLTEVERKNWINNRILLIGKNTLGKQTFDKIVEQAKEMEKEQIIKAAYDNMNAIEDDPLTDAKEYYNEKYGK